MAVGSIPSLATEAWWKDPPRADLLGAGRPELFDSPSVHPTKPMAINRLSDFHFRGCACKHFGLRSEGDAGAAGCFLCCNARLRNAGWKAMATSLV